MELFLIDAISPFFRGYEKQRVNWSKIPFTHLMDASPERWQQIEHDLRKLATQVTAQGYNAVTLDDLAHLATHPLHEPEIATHISKFRENFGRLFAMLHHEFGLKIFLTTDVLPLTPAVAAGLGTNTQILEDYYQTLVCGVLDDFPLLNGLILRIGESDGNDVSDPIRTQLHLRNAKETNRLLGKLLPEFEKRGRQLILRTWTVGAHPIGDLIWHRETLADTLKGLDSPNFIVSMKHGESDFFRYLPLNPAFFQVSQRKIIELQARREYEGAGEYPSYIGRDCERFARELEAAPNMVGMSVWCQTGGWHRFRRLAYLEDHQRDVWIRLNTEAAIGIFKHLRSADTALTNMLGADRAVHAIELLNHADTLIHELFYIGDFARQKLFFRRVRIPPLLHVYWDSLFINHAVKKIITHFVPNPGDALRNGEAAAEQFPRMLELARKADLPVDDIEHMRDFFSIVLLARRYYFLPFDDSLSAQIQAAKKHYKHRWHRKSRERYRVKVSFEPFHLKRQTLAWIAGLLLRRKRGYRMIDRIFTLGLLGFGYRMFRPRDPKSMPKFLRKSAMGVDALFK